MERGVAVLLQERLDCPQHSGGPAVEDGVEGLAPHLAGEVEPLGALADPPTGPLAGPGVVLVEAAGRGVLVVGLRPVRRRASLECSLVRLLRRSRPDQFEMGFGGTGEDSDDDDT